MISLVIDGVEIRRVNPSTLSLSISAETMRSVEAAALNSDFIIEAKIDSSNHESLSLLSGDGYTHDGAKFNSSRHTGGLLFDGEMMIEGVISLLSSVVDEDHVRFKLRLRRAGAAWAITATKRLLHNVSLEYNERLDISTMEESWNNDSFIKYLPVHRDSYSPTYSSTSIDTVRRIRSVDDYHPFINVYALMMRVFEESRYSVVSQFMESDLFKKLYISGAYVSQSSSKAKAAMDFYAVKLDDVSTTADYTGRVNISPLYPSNSVGYLVDFDSIEERAECYSLGGALSVVSGALTFTPTQAVSVGFEVRLKYTSDYKIKSRTALKAFDSLYLEGSMIYSYGVANRFIDQRDEELEMLFEYKVVAFDGDDSATYELTIMVNGVERSLGSWVGSSGEVTTPRFDDTDSVGSPKLYVTYSGGSRILYSYDWAMYMGYIELEGEVEVDVTVRTPPQSASPSNPISLIAPFISGAEPGMSFTLKAETSLKPFFAGYPGYGSNVEYSDLSQHEAYAADFVESIRHLFNLAIYSDTAASRVYIEPEEDIYDTSTVWDWSDKIIYSEPITFTDVAVDASRRRKFGYQQSDGVTTRIAGFYYEPGETYPDTPTREPEQSIEGAYSEEYGSWEVDIDSYVAADTTRSKLNPMLSPTINDTLGIPIVGDRDNPDMADTLEFSPRILSLEGMMYSDNELIPNAVFFSEDRGVNLCFEDREGVNGLNKYYRKSIEREERGQYVELSLRLTPSELYSLFSPSDGVPHILSTFALRIFGERCECRIESIELKSGEAGIKSHIAKCKLLLTDTNIQYNN